MSHETSLRDTLERQLDRAASEVLNIRGHAAGCRPLTWSIPRFDAPRRTRLQGSADLTDYEPADALAVVQQWATVFDLVPDPAETPGTARFQGHIAGIAVRVWTVTDHDLFERIVRDIVAKYRRPDAQPQNSDPDHEDANHDDADPAQQPNRRTGDQHPVTGSTGPDPAPTAVDNPGDSTPGQGLSWDQRVSDALRVVFPAGVAAELTADLAYGALFYRLSRYCQGTDTTPVQALAQLDPDDLDFATRADNPAAFLARKVSEL